MASGVRPEPSQRLAPLGALGKAGEATHDLEGLDDVRRVAEGTLGERQRCLRLPASA
jgi:hypothetical protein